MSSPPQPVPIAGRLSRTEENIPAGFPRSTSSGGDDPSHTAARHSPTLTRSYDPTDPELVERQRTMDVDFAIQLSRARSASIAHAQRPSISVQSPMVTSASGARSGSRDTPRSPLELALSESEAAPFPTIGSPHHEEEEEEEFGLGGGSCVPGGNAISEPVFGTPTTHIMGYEQPEESHQHLPHPPAGLQARISKSVGIHNGTIPYDRLDTGQTSPYRSPFDFSAMEQYSREERERLGIAAGTRSHPLSKNPDLRRKLAQVAATRGVAETPPPAPTPPEDSVNPDPDTTTSTGTGNLLQRKISQNTPVPRKANGGKLALFESTLGASSSPHSNSFDRESPTPLPHHYQPAIPLHDDEVHEEKPYRFSFYSNAIPATIHARTLSELPAEGQTFEELFYGNRTNDGTRNGNGTKRASMFPPGGSASGTATPYGKGGLTAPHDEDANTWWLDILSPTDEEMRILSKAFGIHPLTAEDIAMEETREKIELFRNYYLVCFRSFDQNPYSATHLEPINYYIVVFREGTLSFHFRSSPHPQNVRRRIKQLKDYISVTSDWISYALIDDITDAFGPLIQGIEYEVDNIDELVLILKEAEQSDMLRRIGTCRKKVMGLLRLMGNKADVVKGLAKRCNENWSMAPKSDIGLYLSDIQDHLITMTQSLNHYEKLLSRSHSNYLAQISIEMTDANNQINDVLSRLTALGTILIPMNLVTGLWGMNVHVPGQDVKTGYAWFIGIICLLVGFGVIGGIVTYRLMRRSRR